MKFTSSILLFFFLVALPYSVKAAQYAETPTKIVIPSIKLSLPVHTAKIIFNTWEVHLDGASFGEGTTLPGNLGNTVIFSHAMIGLFGNLHKVKAGDLVHVFTGSDWFVYKVEKTFVVEPTQISVLQGTNSYELTLYTCTGPDWSQRFIVQAKLLSDPSSLLN